jgi:UDP-glucose 4-epimerase
VIVLDDFSTGRMENLEQLMAAHPERVTLVSGSVVDAGVVSKLASSVDVVAHLAASVGVQLIVSKPLETLLNNVRGTEVVLEAAARTGAKVMITSTSEIYGKNAAGPLREDADRILGSPLVSRWSYSTSKAVDEIFAYGYWREQALPTVIVRLFNCAGPRQTGTYGMVIPRFVRQALSGEDLTVYGDGTQARSFCHVADTVDALIALLDEPRAVGDVFNVGAQNETTIHGLAKLVLELTGSSSSIRFLSYEEAYEPGFEDMERRLPHIGKIQQLLGWRPSRSLRDIVRDVVAFELARSVPMESG